MYGEINCIQTRMLICDLYKFRELEDRIGCSALKQFSSMFAPCEELAISTSETFFADSNDS